MTQPARDNIVIATGTRHFPYSLAKKQNDYGSSNIYLHEYQTKCDKALLPARKEKGEEYVIKAQSEDVSLIFRLYSYPESYWLQTGFSFFFLLG
jgi:hypothetical protein